MNTPFRLDGRIAFVTGGASGIGEATCRVLAAAGASVIIADLNLEAGQKLASELPGSRAVRCDITSPDSVHEVFVNIPRLDILVNNAGIGHVGSIEETGLEDFQKLYKVNVEGMFLVTKAAVPLLKASKGAIVNIGSVAGLVGIKRRFAYCATKGAVVMLTRQLAVEYATDFRVNCIAPGTVETPFVEGYLDRFHRHEKEEVRVQLHARQPVGRMGRPDEIAHLVLYLCAPESQFMTGSVVTIDGGWTAA